MHGGKEGDAELIGAVSRMARAVVKYSSQFDYRDIAQAALLYVLERDYPSPEYRVGAAVQKCRGEFLDRVKSPAGSRTISMAIDRIIELEERRPTAPLPFGLYPQELRVYAGEVYREFLANPPKRGRGRPIEP